jgi:hypothetical protein
MGDVCPVPPKEVPPPVEPEKKWVAPMPEHRVLTGVVCPMPKPELPAPKEE